MTPEKWKATAAAEQAAFYDAGLARARAQLKHDPGKAFAQAWELALCTGEPAHVGAVQRLLREAQEYHPYPQLAGFTFVEAMAIERLIDTDPRSAVTQVIEAVERTQAYDALELLRYALGRLQLSQSEHRSGKTLR